MIYRTEFREFIPYVIIITIQLKQIYNYYHIIMTFNYFCIMKPDIKILQKSINIDHDRMINCLILIFMENGVIQGSSVVPLPGWFNFCSEEYRCYPLCLN